jgi:predicted DNA-binding transcriptional regulator AlpA
MSTSIPPHLHKKLDVCSRLGFSARTLEGMVNDKKFPPGCRIGKHLYWTETVIQKWLDRQFGVQEAWEPGGIAEQRRNRASSRDH